MDILILNFKSRAEIFTTFNDKELKEKIDPTAFHDLLEKATSGLVVPDVAVCNVVSCTSIENNAFEKLEFR